MITRLGGKIAPFEPAWWLPGPHLQTLWPVLARKRPTLPLKHEQLELEDGDFLDLAWLGSRGPTVIIMHGLEGSIESHYVCGLMQQLHQDGFLILFMHFRGCGGKPNRLERSYHSGDTADFNRIVEYITLQTSEPPFAAIAFSLGGNVLLKWLGEQGKRSLLKAAVAVSVPFILNDCALKLEKGFSRIYQRHLVRRLQGKYLTKFKDRPSPLSVDIKQLNTFRKFDDQVTAPLHGFDGVDDYYDHSSSRQFLRCISTPSLIIHAKDDPFMYPTTVPERSELPDCVELELYDHGGHVGFIAGNRPWNPIYWIEQRVSEYMLQQENK